MTSKFRAHVHSQKLFSISSTSSETSTKLSYDTNPKPKKREKTLQIKEEVEQIQESQQSQDWCWTQDPHSLQRSSKEFFALGHHTEILMGQCDDAMRLYVARMQDWSWLDSPWSYPLTADEKTTISNQRSCVLAQIIFITGISNCNSNQACMITIAMKAHLPDSLWMRCSARRPGPCSQEAGFLWTQCARFLLHTNFASSVRIQIRGCTEEP